MLRFLIVASGSKGNCTLLDDGHDVIMIDCGISCAKIKEGFEQLGRTMSSLSALFITHEHIDHVLSLKSFKGLAPIYGGRGTPLEFDYQLDDFQEIKIGNFRVLTLPTMHDAAHPLGYLFFNGEEKLVYITDTGLLSDDVLKHLMNADFYIFESNHDYRLLKRSHRPIALIERIHSEHGHLSNLESAKYLANLIGPKTKEVILAHVSEECNSDKCLLETFHRIFLKNNLSSFNFKMEIARQYLPLFGGDNDL